MSDRLAADAVAAELEAHPGWSLNGGALQRTFERGDFDDAIAFVNAVAATANALDHHPDIALSWNEVTIRSWSHDVDGITPRDFRLISAIDAL